MKKKITPVQIAVLFTGSFLDAGFLSGQELLQFFGQFGTWGLGGMVLALAAFWVFGFLVLRIAKITGRLEFEKIILHVERPLLRGMFSAIFLIFLFGVMVGMIAGAGALLQQVFGIPILIGDGVMTLLVLVFAAAGAAGLLASFGVVVPLLVVSALVVATFALLRLPIDPLFSAPLSSGNPLLGNWFFSALSFISYNMMAGITILVPLTRDMEDDRDICKGLALGSVMLAVIFVCILLPMILFRSLAGSADLPMLALASQIAPALGIVYAILLFCGMFTAALSSLFGITARLEVKLGGRVPLWVILVLCALAFAGSIFGFKNMISYVYPICGYVGFLALIGVVLHYRFLRKNGNGSQQLSD